MAHEALLLLYTAAQRTSLVQRERHVAGPSSSLRWITAARANASPGRQWYAEDTCTDNTKRTLPAVMAYADEQAGRGQAQRLRAGKEGIKLSCSELQLYTQQALVSRVKCRLLAPAPAQP